ncbi:MAG: tetratricopeptide repeat protein [Pirellulales bacterium]|nr:tetratricopeptide repeat protein [Pirellulales bacterium]
MPVPNVPEDVTPQRERREAAAVEQFEAQRDEIQMQAARAAWDRGDLPACRETLDILLARTPSHRDARLLLAGACMEQGRPAEAVGQIEAALADHPRDPAVHNAMGVLLEELGRADEAAAYFQRAADFVEHEVVIQASCQTPEGPQGPAEAQEASFSPDRAEDDAKTGFDEAARRAAAENLLGRAETALAQGQTEQAVAWCRKAAAFEPRNPYIPTTAAVTALRMDRPDVAIQVARESIDRFPRCCPLYRVLATAHYRQGEFQRAQLVLQQALSLDKSDPLAYFLMGCTLAKLGQPEAAAAHFRQAESLRPALANRAETEWASSLR